MEATILESSETLTVIESYNLVKFG